MNIRNLRELRAFASERVDASSNQKNIVLIYTGITLALAGIIPIVNYLLGLRIDQSGGLSNMGIRTVLSSLQTMMPIAVGMVTMCLDLGYLAAMLRIARGQYASSQTLRLGFDRFWVLLRSQILRMIILFGILMLSIYLGIMLFMVSPFSQDAIAILSPYLGSVSDPTTLLLDEAIYSQFLTAVIPAYVLCGILFAILGGPMLYSYRMVDYILIDKPAIGAMEALRRSKRMMHGSRIALLKLDLSQWKYYLATFAAHVLCYGDLLLPMLGVELPWHEDIWYFAFMGVYLAALGAVYYFLRNKVETAYALAYDAVKPEEPKDSGVVLGNIFQL